MKNTMKNEKTQTWTGSTCSQTENKKKQHRNKLSAILFWIIFFLLIVFATISGVLYLTNIMEVAGQFIEAQYSQADITALTQSLQEDIDEQNSQMHKAYGLDIVLLPDYEVYSSADGTYAVVLYKATFANSTYLLMGSTRNQYVDGLMTLKNERNARIEAGNYKWDDTWVPEPGYDVPIPTITPMPTATPIPDAPITDKTDDTEEVIERGGGDEEEDYGTE